ncbi:hypothetical protein [Desulfitobacterium sp. AusDCA]|uniref:hypothetical protein n=1 Tax=Desulfitobacterium sp. AusDCA TaxID=3240383 RepID=UPI003DA6D8CC
MRPEPFPRMNQSYLLIVLILLILAAFLRTSLSSVSTSVTSNWNTQVIDVTRNHNAALAFYLLETNPNPAPVNALARNVITSPSNYFGKYLQLSGTIQSVQTYPSQNNLPGLIIGNTTELVMIANDGVTVVDCLLVNEGINLTIGSTITINGYTPGIRYVQNSQTALTQELVIIGRAV